VTAIVKSTGELATPVVVVARAVIGVEGFTEHGVAAASAAAEITIPIVFIAQRVLISLLREFYLDL
jgi:hypothetical protein